MQIVGTEKDKRFEIELKPFTIVTRHQRRSIQAGISLKKKGEKTHKERERKMKKREKRKEKKKKG